MMDSAASIAIQLDGAAQKLEEVNLLIVGHRVTQHKSLQILLRQHSVAKCQQRWVKKYYILDRYENT